TAAAGTNYNLNIGNLLQGDMTNSTALGTEALFLQSTASSVDYVQIAGGATGSPGTVTISGQGTDSNVNIELLPKGTGNVGIGTASPQTTLQVQGDIYADVGDGSNSLTMNNAGTDYGQIFSQGTNTWSLGHGTSLTSGATSVLSWTKGGLVGIGTTTPQSKLDVNGNITIGSYAGATAAPANSMIISGTVAIGTSAETT